MYEIKFLKKAEKDFKGISKPELVRIFDKIETDLAHNPGKHKELKGSANIYSYRVGPYRVIYTIENKTIIIAKIGHRKDVYDN